MSTLDAFIFVAGALVTAIAVTGLVLDWDK